MNIKMSTKLLEKSMNNNTIVKLNMSIFTVSSG